MLGVVVLHEPILCALEFVSNEREKEVFQNFNIQCAIHYLIEYANVGGQTSGNAVLASCLVCGTLHIG